MLYINRTPSCFVLSRTLRHAEHEYLAHPHSQGASVVGLALFRIPMIQRADVLTSGVPHPQAPPHSQGGSVEGLVLYRTPMIQRAACVDVQRTPHPPTPTFSRC